MRDKDRHKERLARFAAILLAERRRVTGEIQCLGAMAIFTLMRRRTELDMARPHQALHRACVGGAREARHDWLVDKALLIRIGECAT